MEPIKSKPVHPLDFEKGFEYCECPEPLGPDDFNPVETCMRCGNTVAPSPEALKAQLDRKLLRKFEAMKSGDRINVFNISCKIISKGKSAIVFETVGTRKVKFGSVKNRFNNKLIGRECSLYGFDFVVTKIHGKRLVIRRK